MRNKRSSSSSVYTRRMGDTCGESAYNVDGLGCDSSEPVRRSRRYTTATIISPSTRRMTSVKLFKYTYRFCHRYRQSVSSKFYNFSRSTVLQCYKRRGCRHELYCLRPAKATIISPLAISTSTSFFRIPSSSYTGRTFHP